VIALWDEIGDRSEEIVPAYGFAQAERELATAARPLPSGSSLRNGGASTTRQGGKSIS
jgi:hypothetical protein